VKVKLELYETQYEISEAFHLGNKTNEAITLLEFLAQLTNDGQDDRSFRYLERLGLYLNSKRRYEDARRRLVRAWDASSKPVGEYDADTISVAHNLGLVYFDTKEYEKAEEFLRPRLAEAQESPYVGKDHFQTLRVAGLIADVFHARGKYDEAIDRYGEVLEVCSKSPRFSMEWNRQKADWGLADCYRLQGKPFEAEQHLEQVLAEYNELFGPEDKATLWIKDNLDRSFDEMIKGDGLGHDGNPLSRTAASDYLARGFGKNSAKSGSNSAIVEELDEDTPMA